MTRVLAAHSPGYLPNLAFFFKLLKSDVFVLADALHFSKHAEINRTRIKTAHDVHWLTVPVITHGLGPQRIFEVEIDATQNWARKHWRSLRVSYGYAAYFEKFADFFERQYLGSWTNLLELNLAFFDFLLSQFQFSGRLYRLSELGIQATGSRLLIELLKALECDIYLADRAWKDYLDMREFSRHGYQLRFFDLSLQPYHQLFGNFKPNLSIIDLLFNESERAQEILLSSGTMTA